MRDVCTDFETGLAGFSGEASHVHLLVNFPPKVALSRLVNSLKGLSSRRLRQEFPELRRHYWKANRLWSGSYFAGSAARTASASTGVSPPIKYSARRALARLLRNTGRPG